MSILNQIEQMVPEDSTLNTPSKGKKCKKFVVIRIRQKGLTIGIGEDKRELFIRSACFDGVIDFLRDKGWIRIGAIHDTDTAGTFDEYVKKFTRGISAASYVAPILEKVGIVEINDEWPAKLRLIKQAP